LWCCKHVFVSNSNTFGSRSNIGGGGFMTIRIPPSNQSASNSHVYTIGFREVAPASSNSTMFKSNLNLVA
jgi:gamma-glutamyltranspeptidase